MEQNQTFIPKEELPEILARISGLKRVCWEPITVEGDGKITDSKFSGTPLVTGEWPACGKCGKPMVSFLQLNLNSVPEETKGAFGTGLLQLFYCDDDTDYEDYDVYKPFSKCHLTRIVPNVAGQTQTPTPDFDTQPFLPARVITGWKRQDDYPEEREMDEMGFRLSEVEAEAYDYFMLRNAPGDKLGGWPNWIQGIEYPNCPICGERMQLVFQLDSDDNLAFSFGDLGRGHITQCPQHKEQVTFAWSCC